MIGVLGRLKNDQHYVQVSDAFFDIPTSVLDYYIEVKGAQKH